MEKRIYDAQFYPIERLNEFLQQKGAQGWRVVSVVAAPTVPTQSLDRVLVVFEMIRE